MAISSVPEACFHLELPLVFSKLTGEQLAGLVGGVPVIQHGTDRVVGMVGASAVDEDTGDVFVYLYLVNPQKKLIEI